MSVTYRAPLWTTVRPGSWTHVGAATPAPRSGSVDLLTQRGADEFAWIHGGNWESPRTGAVYPISPVIETTDPATGERRRFRLRPYLPDQEITGGAGGVSYWEGACDVVDEATGEVVGRAFLEMTGYADDVGRFLR